MRHARQDYARFQDPAGLVPADEPVFLLRGQDACAAAAVRYYAELVRVRGGDSELAYRAEQWADEMTRWATKKMPDMPRDKT